jgi:hypothetical protein
VPVPLQPLPAEDVQDLDAMHLIGVGYLCFAQRSVPSG